MAEVKIENVVASTSLGVTFNLEQIAVSLENAQYEPEQFPGIVYRVKEPKSAALIFGSGKIICTGAKGIDKAKLAIRQVLDDIRKHGVEVPGEEVVEIQNVVATSDLHAVLNLDAIAIGLDRTEYEPEQFPGLVYRMDVPKAVLLLFGSGKIVITGVKNAEEAELAADTVTERLSELDLLTPSSDSTSTSESKTATKKA